MTPGRRIAAFDILSVCLIKNVPDPPHTEDWLFDDRSVAFIRTLDAQSSYDLLTSILDPDIASIFGTPILEGRYARRGQGNRSLGTVRPSGEPFLRITVVGQDGPIRLRAELRDESGAEWCLPVTDLSALRAAKAWIKSAGLPGAGASINEWIRQREVFFPIGLARGWKQFPDRCYLQVAGVYASPGPNKRSLGLPFPGE